MPKYQDIKSVLLIGAGPIIIGPGRHCGLGTLAVTQ